MEEASDFVVIGGSNAKSLGEVLHTKGKKVIQLTEKSLKVGPTTIDNLCKQIAEKVDESMVVVLMVTDNMAFLVETEEGESHLPKRDDGGKYHVDGQLKLASVKQVRKNSAEVSSCASTPEEKQENYPGAPPEIHVHALLPGHGSLHQQEGAGLSAFHAGGPEGGQAGAEGGLP